MLTLFCMEIFYPYVDVTIERQDRTCNNILKEVADNDLDSRSM